MVNSGMLRPNEVPRKHLGGHDFEVDLIVGKIRVVLNFSKAEPTSAEWHKRIRNKANRFMSLSFT